jgi:hypothetical protein
MNPATEFATSFTSDAQDLIEHQQETIRRDVNLLLSDHHCPLLT